MITPLGSLALFAVSFLVVVGIPVLGTMLTVALSLSRQYWIWRFAALWGVLVAFYPTGAFGPLLVAAWSLPIILFAVMWLHARTVATDSTLAAATASKRPNYSLRDLFLATAVVGGWLAASLALHEKTPGPVIELFVLPALGWVAISLCAFGFSYWRLPWLNLALIVPCSFAVAYYCAPGENDMMTSATLLYGAALPYSDVKPWMYCWAYLVESGLLMAIGIALLKRSWPAQHQTARRWQLALLSFLLLFGVPGMAAYYELVRPPILPPPWIEGSNGFPRLVELCTEFQQLDPYKLGTPHWTGPLDPTIAPRRQELFDAIVAQADQPSFLPTELVDDRDLLGGRLLDDLRPFCRRAAADASSVAPENPDRASELSLAAIGIGSQIQRNGFHLHLLLGIANEAQGLRELIRVRTEISAEQQQLALARLVRINTEREPLSVIARRDRWWCEKYLRWNERLANGLERFAEGKSTTPMDYAASIQRRDVFVRLLIVDLSIRIYQREKGELPATIESLVPEYLPSIPTDPYSDRPFSYRRTEDEFALYSVGLNRSDDGGVFGTVKQLWAGSVTTPSNLDVDLETMIR